jgi:hypothetical protein
MRAGSGWARVSLVVLVAAGLFGACGGKTEAPCDQAAEAAGCGGSSVPDWFEYPDTARQFCDELFAEYDGCGKSSMEVCLMQWATDDSCDDEEEALLDCLLHGDGYQCNHGVLLNTLGACQDLAEEQNDCQEGRE